MDGHGREWGDVCVGMGGHGCNLKQKYRALRCVVGNCQLGPFCVVLVCDRILWG